ncbi:MAG TPA: hypothetical protein VLG47_03510 [Candidatus Saccharimonadales bacterium]|nr:hypothetical protein [Candidatus Saccharimonadales bacterium]
MAKQDFGGVWHSIYHYKHPDLPGLQKSEHDVKIYRKGDELIIESLPNDENSYLIVHLKLDGNIATGSWEEHTSPTGAHKREIYSGAVQFVLSDDGNDFDGMYLTFDRRNFVKSNYWHLYRQ